MRKILNLNEIEQIAKDMPFDPKIPVPRKKSRASK
jgi:hypothetical protein